MDFNEGEIIYIDKPLHWTSFDVVKRIRVRILRRIKQKKLKVGMRELSIRWLRA